LNDNILVRFRSNQGTVFLLVAVIVRMVSSHVASCWVQIAELAIITVLILKRKIFAPIVIHAHLVALINAIRTTVLRIALWLPVLANVLANVPVSFSTWLLPFPNIVDWKIWDFYVSPLVRNVSSHCAPFMIQIAVLANITIHILKGIIFAFIMVITMLVTLLYGKGTLTTWIACDLLLVLAGVMSNELCSVDSIILKSSRSGIHLFGRARNPIS
jgi:hypothetical protein